MEKMQSLLSDPESMQQLQEILIMDIHLRLPEFGVQIVFNN